MKKTKNWKIVNYLDQDVLFHPRNPKCIVACTEKEIPSNLISFKKKDKNFYILHWLEKEEMTDEQKSQVLHEASDHWKKAA